MGLPINFPCKYSGNTSFRDRNILIRCFHISPRRSSLLSYSSWISRFIYKAASPYSLLFHAFLSSLPLVPFFVNGIATRSCSGSLASGAQPRYVYTCTLHIDGNLPTASLLAPFFTLAVARSTVANCEYAHYCYLQSRSLASPPPFVPDFHGIVESHSILSRPRSSSPSTFYSSYYSKLFGHRMYGMSF